MGAEGVIVACVLVFGEIFATHVDLDCDYTKFKELESKETYVRSWLMVLTVAIVASCLACFRRKVKVSREEAVRCDQVGRHRATQW